MIWACAIKGHEHAAEAEATDCIAWLRENWDDLKDTGLPVRREVVVAADLVKELKALDEEIMRGIAAMSESVRGLLQETDKFCEAVEHVYRR